MKNINERRLALAILSDIKNGVPSQAALQDMAGYARVGGIVIDKRARGFVTQLVYGTLENYIYIDYIIEEFTGRPVSKQKPFIAGVLELSVYQLLFLRNIPDHAVVNEAVRLVQTSPQRGLKGFVNGLLRNIARNRDALPVVSGDEDHVLSVKYSVPEFIVRLLGRQGEPKESILKGLRSRRPVTIRCNTSLTTPEELKKTLEAEGVKVTKTGGYPDYAFAISGYDSIPELKSFKDGLFYVQDISGMLSCEASCFRPGESVLDLCAAPGGKSIGAALCGAVVESRDKTPSKAELIKANVTRLRLNNIYTDVADATVFDPSLEERFCAVIADVPCSGLGIIGRKPDICLHITPEGIDDLIRLQRDVLRNAVRYVKPGGRLIFSTCTINPAENEENGRFLESLGLKGVFEKQWLPREGGETDGFYTKILKKS